MQTSTSQPTNQKADVADLWEAHGFFERKGGRVSEDALSASQQRCIHCWDTWQKHERQRGAVREMRAVEGTTGRTPNSPNGKTKIIKIAYIVAVL